MSDDATRTLLWPCLRCLWDPSALETMRAILARGEVDWDSLCQTARRESLEPLLYRIVRGHGLVAPTVEQEWQRVYYTNALRSDRLFHELQDVMRRFAAADVDVLLLKGAALAQTVYGDIAARPMADLDLLVPEDQVELAQAVLADLNYGSASSEPWPGFARRYRNALAYARPSAGTPPYLVGLHWGLLNVQYYERIPIQGWFDRAQRVEVAGVAALVPAPEDHLVYLCGHLALHHRHDPALLRYCDIAMLLQHTGEALDWDAVVQRAVDWRLVISLQRTLARLEELWPGMMPASIIQEIAALQPMRIERWIHKWVDEPRDDHIPNVVPALVTMPGAMRRVGFLLEALFPSPAYMRQEYCPQYSGLSPRVYLHHVGLGLRYLLSRLG
jgi:hypothetical protein